MLPLKPAASDRPFESVGIDTSSRRFANALARVTPVPDHAEQCRSQNQRQQRAGLGQCLGNIEPGEGGEKAE